MRTLSHFVGVSHPQPHNVIVCMRVFVCFVLVFGVVGASVDDGSGSGSGDGDGGGDGVGVAVALSVAMESGASGWPEWSEPCVPTE